jgi:hypothetical protein
MEARFVASRVLWMFPSFAAIVAFTWAANSTRFPLMLLAHIGLLAFIAWLAYRQSDLERQSVEEWIHIDFRFAETRDGGIRSHWLPLSGAVLITGSIWAIIRHDARWLIVVAVVGALLGVGLVLRWVVYDRWLAREIRLLGFRLKAMDA